MQDPLLDLPPEPDVRSWLWIVLPTLAALCAGLSAPSAVRPIAVGLTDCSSLATLESGLFAASVAASGIAVATALCALGFRRRLNPGWRTIPPRYEILRWLYLGASVLLGIGGLYVWSRGHHIRFGEGCDAGFDNPWAFAFKLLLIVVSWICLANLRLMLSRVHAAVGEP